MINRERKPDQRGRDSRPYMIVARKIADDIKAGRYRAGEALPRTVDFAAGERVGYNVAVAALQELARAGYVVVRGPVRYVADSLPDAGRGNDEGVVKTCPSCDGSGEQ